MDIDAAVDRSVEVSDLLDSLAKVGDPGLTADRSCWRGTGGICGACVRSRTNCPTSGMNWPKCRWPAWS